MKPTDEQLLAACDEALAAEPHTADKLARAATVILNRAAAGEPFEQPEWWEIVALFFRAGRHHRVAPPAIK